MATGLQRIVRHALLARLKADPSVTVLVPAAQIDPVGQTRWPFITLAAPVSQPLRAAGLSGGSGSFDIHAFAGPREVDGVTVETARDHAGRIGQMIEECFKLRRSMLSNGMTLHVGVTDMRLLPDDTPDCWHYFAQVNWRVLA